MVLRNDISLRNRNYYEVLGLEGAAVNWVVESESLLASLFVLNTVMCFLPTGPTGEGLKL